MEVGFSDYYAGGYECCDWTGDISEIDDDTYNFSGYDVHFLLVSGESADEAVAEEATAEEGTAEEFEEYIILSGHIDDCYNGVYYRGDDWYDLPHYVHEESGGCISGFGGYRHLYYLYTSYLQLDYRDQELYGFYDYYSGGCDYGPYTGDISEFDDHTYNFNGYDVHF